MQKLILALTFSLLACLAQADTSLWKVTNGSQEIFLGGTIHLLADSDYPLPNEYEVAYRRAQRLVFEVDLPSVQGPEFQQLMMQKMSYGEGGRVQDDLSAETVAALEAHFNSRGLSLAQFESYKPSLLSIVLTVIEMQRLGMAEGGVEDFFSERALDDHKPQSGLETAAEQIDFLAAMGRGQEDEMIAYTLIDLKELPQTLATMKQAWREGDTEALVEIGLTPWYKEFPEVYQNLLVSRNNNWLPQLEVLLSSSEISMVLVGALHLVGPDGLLAQLEQRGYVIERF